MEISFVLQLFQKEFSIFYVYDMGEHLGLEMGCGWRGFVMKQESLSVNLIHFLTNNSKSGGCNSSLTSNQNLMT